MKKVIAILALASLMVACKEPKITNAEATEEVVEVEVTPADTTAAVQ